MCRNTLFTKKNFYWIFFAISNFIDKNKFKVWDVDELKLKLVKVPSLLRKYPELSDLKLSNPQDVSRLHAICSAEKIPEKELELWIGNFHQPETLPNLLFDMTFKNTTNIDWVMPMLIKAGYKPHNIHVTWVLTNFKIAIQNNRKRARRVSDLIMLQTHTGAALTMKAILDRGLPKDINGSFTIILNNPEETIYYDTQNKTKLVKDFTYIKVKNAGQPMPSFEEMDIQIKDRIVSWVLQNAPEMKEIQAAFGLE
jgi:hypothetical protein